MRGKERKKIMNKKLAVVTGAAGDIGTDICMALLKANYDVVSVDIVDGPFGTLPIVADIADRDQVKASTLSSLAVDVLVNGAGITRDKFLHKMDDDDWDKVIGINLTGAYNVTRAVIGGMRDRKYGRIVNISSVNGVQGQIGQTNYSASKAAMHGFTMALAKENAFKNVLVNTISPGYIDTRMTKGIADHIKADIVKTIPLGRMGTTGEVSRAVMFLIDEDNTYITGANLHINGGLYTGF